MENKKIAVFISGRGSNFKAILDQVKKGNIRGEIVLVISDNAEAPGLRYAEQEKIEKAVFIKQRGEPREHYYDRIMELLREKRIDLIVLAGFMKILSKNIIEQYKNRIMNIHPALLPSFPGTHAQKQALEYGVKYSGCTVHFVDEGVDSGPIIIQEVVPVLDDDTEETLSDRILKREHIAFPRAVALFCEGRLIVEGRRVFIKKQF